MEVADWEPYNKKTLSLTFKLRKLESTFSRFSKSTNFYVENKDGNARERECSVVSTSLPDIHIAFIVSPKPCLNLCSFRRLNCYLRWIRSLTPGGSYIENIEFFLHLINVLKILTGLGFLISTVRLFHSFMQYGKKYF